MKILIIGLAVAGAVAVFASAFVALIKAREYIKDLY